MPINLTSPSSYFTTVPLFINHWNDANGLGGAILLDKDACGQAADVARADLIALFTSLTTKRDTLEGTLLDVVLLNLQVLEAKTWLQAAVVMFNQAVRADHGKTVYARVLRDAPRMSDARGKFLKPLRVVWSLWPKVDVFRAGLTPPKAALTLASGAAYAQFSAKLAALEAALDAVDDREVEAMLERAFRNEVQGAIYPILKVYRAKLEAVFPAGSAIVLSLPALTEDATATPEAGTLAGNWNATTSEANLTGTPSPSASVVQHEVRASLGPEPNADDESMKAEFALGVPIVFNSDYGLATPGARVHYRLVAVTGDGHEKGTPWVTIERPL